MVAAQGQPQNRTLERFRRARTPISAPNISPSKELIQPEGLGGETAGSASAWLATVLEGEISVAQPCLLCSKRKGCVSGRKLRRPGFECPPYPVLAVWCNLSSPLAFQADSFLICKMGLIQSTS